ncbi:hypothetical protein NQZ79_g8406 [Umbelopsis isabellina]|nr:hypothetical protein NQZ79_g8406 [Umbelopsis isabellina]
MPALSSGWKNKRTTSCPKTLKEKNVCKPDQHHNYALPVIDPRDPRLRNRGQYGITTLNSPECPFPVLPLPSSSPYISSFRIGTTHLVCCYIPPDLNGSDNSTAFNDILTPFLYFLIPYYVETSSLVGPITGDTTTTSRGRLRVHRAAGLDKVPWWERYLAALHSFRLGVSRAQRQANRAFCDVLERNFAAVTSKIMAIRRRRQTQPTYCHPDGPVVAVETMSQ